MASKNKRPSRSVGPSDAVSEADTKPAKQRVASRGGATTVPRLASQILELGEQLTRQHELEVGRLKVAISNLLGENAVLQAELKLARSQDNSKTDKTEVIREKTNQREFLASEHSLQPLVTKEAEDVPVPMAEETIPNEDKAGFFVEAEKSLDFGPQISQLVDIYLPGLTDQDSIALPRKGISSVYGPGLYVADESIAESPEFHEDGADSRACAPIPGTHLLRTRTTGQIEPVSVVDTSRTRVIAGTRTHWDCTQSGHARDIRPQARSPSRYHKSCCVGDNINFDLKLPTSCAGNSVKQQVAEDTGLSCPTSPSQQDAPSDKSVQESLNLHERLTAEDSFLERNASLARRLQDEYRNSPCRNTGNNSSCKPSTNIAM